MFEINCNRVDETNIRDSSGNGHKAILLGDYSINKEDINIDTVRDSAIDIPEVNDNPSDGAI